MKAVLVIDEMPKHCFECYFRGGEDQYSVCCTPDLAGEEVGEYDECRPDFCPLRPMPAKVTETLDDGSFYDGSDHGWNDCIESIEGSGEDG